MYVWIAFAMRSTGRSMDYSVCSMADEMTLRAASVSDAKVVVHDGEDYQNGENGLPDDAHNVTNADEASIIDEYFGLHHVTTTSGSSDVIVSEIPRAYDADDGHWLDQSTNTPNSGCAVTSQSRLFTSGEDIPNRKYYDFVPPPDFADLGAYGTSGTEVRPPPCYPTKREDKVDEDVLVRPPESGNISRINKLYTGSYSAADAYFSQYGTGAFPVLFDQGQYAGGVVATGGVRNDARQPYYLSANGATTGNGNSCAGYLSVDVGGFGSTMLRPLGFQSSTAVWPAAFRQ